MTVRGSLIVLALMAGGHLLYGQGTARIVGVVSDSGGGLVPNAQVTLINDATGLREAASTDDGGRYNFTQLAVGNYRIEVSKPGFKKETQTGVNLVAEQVYTADIRLEIGNVSESVEVTSSSATVETAVSSVRSTVRTELIEDLPLNGRDALSLQTLVPGSVSPAPG
jgi:Carboxypeptidase regulatory-like domain